MTEPLPKLPFQPIFDLLHTDSDLEAAAALGLERRYLRRLVAKGITHSTADELAVRLGHHPSELWAEWGTVPISEKRRPRGD